MMVAFASAGLAREDGTLVDPGGNKLMKAKVASIPACPGSSGGKAERQGCASGRVLGTMTARQREGVSHTDSPGFCLSLLMAAPALVTPQP